MCSPVPCYTCNNVTWAGCGMHVDLVKSMVPADKWCTCENEPQEASTSAFFR